MTLRCRKGDMAIVTHGSKAGRIAGVGEFVGKTRLFIGNSEQIFNDVWCVSYHGQKHDPLDGAEWGCRDLWMTPIRPGDLDENEETESVLEFTE